MKKSLRKILLSGLMGGALLSLPIVLINSSKKEESFLFEKNLEALIQTEDPFMDRHCYQSYEESYGGLAVEVVTCDSCEKRWVTKASKPSECWSGN